MATGVQFKGIDKVVQAFTNRDCCAWSIWSGKQFLFSCVASSANEAAGELSNLLEALDQSGKCVYTLKVYEDVKDGSRITEKTEAHGSFNFRLNEEDEPAGYGRVSGYKEVEALKAEIATLKSELEEDEEDESLVDRIAGVFMEDPAKLPLMLQSLQGVINMFTKQTTVQGQPVTIGAIPGNDEIKAAIEVLKQHDAKLSIHLTKLAQLAVNDPGTFKLLLSTLDNM